VTVKSKKKQEITFSLEDDSSSASLTLLEPVISMAKRFDPFCVICKIPQYRVKVRRDRKGLLFPCEQHFVCWGCGKYLLTQARNTSSTLIYCPQGNCGKRLTVEEVTQRVEGQKCVDCSVGFYDEGRTPVVNALGCPNHFRCPDCSIRYVKHALKRKPNADYFRCSFEGKPCNHRISREAIDELMGKRCFSCKKRSSHFTISKCGSTCDMCLRQYVLQSLSRGTAVGAIPCKLHPFANDCAIDRQTVEQIAGKVCLLCKGRKPSTFTSFCPDHFVCQECTFRYCDRQMRSPSLENGFACPGGGSSCSYKLELLDIKKAVGTKAFEGLLLDRFTDVSCRSCHHVGEFKEVSLLRVKCTNCRQRYCSVCGCIAYSNMYHWMIHRKLLS
jgi:hypothetical protein